MKTKDFLREVEKLGFKVLRSRKSFLIYYEKYLVSYVFINERFHTGMTCEFSEYLSEELKEKLYNLIDEYARTPLDEREEPEKFYLKINMMTRNRCDYLNYYKEEDILMLDVRLETYYAQTQFTQKEIDEMKVKFGLTLSDFEQIPVEEYEEF